MYLGEMNREKGPWCFCVKHCVPSARESEGYYFSQGKEQRHNFRWIAVLTPEPENHLGSGGGPERLVRSEDGRAHGERQRATQDTRLRPRHGRRERGGAGGTEGASDVGERERVLGRRRGVPQAVVFSTELVLSGWISRSTVTANVKRCRESLAVPDPRMLDLPEAAIPSVGPQFLYSRQQLMGSQGYSKGVRLGNWAEDEIRAELEVDAFQKKRAAGTLALNKVQAKVRAGQTPVQLSAAHADGALHFGDTIMITSQLTGASVAANTDRELVESQVAYQVTGAASLEACGRNAFTIVHPNGSEEASGSGNVLRYGEPFALALNSYEGDGVLYLQTHTFALPNMIKQAEGGKEEVAAVTEMSPLCLWYAAAAAVDASGKPVR